LDEYKSVGDGELIAGRCCSLGRNSVEEQEGDENE
jgi:hypothetical protein